MVLPLSTVTFYLSLLSLTCVECKCPRDCTCDFRGSLKRVTCMTGGLTTIPTASMDNDLSILVVSSPRDGQPNDLNLGRMFQNYPDLEEIHITRSNIPAIGESSFWPGKKLKVLNLSQNNITILRETDFHGLKKLQVLNISHNNIATTPSAPFRFLSNLRELSLSHNRFQSLVPRFFFMLPNLEHLDLSGNPLKDVDPENLKDLRPLRRLNLAHCRLERLHSLLYQQLPNLEELDLAYNQFTHFAPEEFRHLRKLKILNLKGNQLHYLSEKTFDGHRLDVLDLANNKLNSLAHCTFCNTTVRDLDLSGNLLRTLTSESLAPVAHTLKTLDISRNPLDNAHLAKVIRPLTRLRWLAMSGTSLRGVPLPNMFVNNLNLAYLDMSDNQIVNLTKEIFQPLEELQELDLSDNHLHGLYPSFLDQVANMTSLRKILLHRNPWTCERCHVEEMLNWMRQVNFYRDACETPRMEDLCLRCASPVPFMERALISLELNSIPFCLEPVSQSQVLVSNSQVGLAVGLFIIVCTVLIILVIVILYRRHGAVYYTHEDDLPEDSSCPGSGDLNGGGSGGQCKRKPAHIYVTSLDRIEEVAEDKPPIRRNSYL